jgi:hypothetical protein
MEDRKSIDPDLLAAFDANTPELPPGRFKPMGAYINRHDADEAAEAMAKSVPMSRWESCQDGMKFAIRRIA